MINHQQRILDLLSTTNRKRSQNGQIPRNNKIVIHSSNEHTSRLYKFKNVEYGDE